MSGMNSTNETVTNDTYHTNDTYNEPRYPEH